MGYKQIQVKLPTDYTEDQLKKAVQEAVGTIEFTYQIEKKSLDARKKNNIHWLMSLIVSSGTFAGEPDAPPPPLAIPREKRSAKIVVTGSGPAGFFAAHVLLKAGFEVTLLERGSEVEKRSGAIRQMENDGTFSPQNNYAFGEGGAGTFSDGKLTSRSKHISEERRFILSEYVRAGAPEEILYMAYPHVGTDHLKKIVFNLRQAFLGNGGKLLFDTQLEDVVVKGGRVKRVVTNRDELEADVLVVATGHSAYDTYRMLMRRGVQFRTKNFAIGHRIEHPQALINKAQWGKEQLPGVKAAEYRLSTKTSSGVPVYTFCMCPGGYVVPSAAYEQRSVVNGMSYYMRDGDYANAGVVAGVHPDMLLGHESGPEEILDWLDALEEQFFAFSGSLVVPAARAVSYMKRHRTGDLPSGSYPLGMQPAALFDMVPPGVGRAIAEGLKDFGRKINGFESGVLMGLESKTSSPIQVLRRKDGLCDGFDNLYFAGEGSGYAGGIISSAADGVKCALAICSAE
jgi:uncharacterized FAD-dependent dehydrogenase